MTRSGIERLTNRYVNGTTAVGDVNPGGAFNDPIGSGVNQYLGQVGAIMELSFAEAQKRSDSVTAPNTTLQGGRYQYVQFAADGTNYAVGQLLYWKDETNFIVTNVAPTATSANFAGFCLSPVTQGNFWFAQVRGVAWALYRAAVTSTTASTAVYALVNTNTVDALTDATADATAGVAKLLIGVAKDAPANGAVKRVYILHLVDAF